MATGAGDMSVKLDDRALRKALALMGRIDDLRPYWPLAHTAFLAAEAEWFGSAGGGSWAPHSAGYTKWLGSHGGGKGILRLTDSLYASLTSEGGGHVWEATSNKVKAGTSNPVANIHVGQGRAPIDGASGVMQKHMAEAMKAIGQQIGHVWEGRL